MEDTKHPNAPVEEEDILLLGRAKKSSKETAPAANEIYQYSLINALMDGVASKGIPIKTVLKHGDFGLGTFTKLQGELIVLNGVAYRMNSGGSVDMLVNLKDQEVECPFAMVTLFQPQVGNFLPTIIPHKEAVLAAIDKHLPHARNHFVSVNVHTATFKSITVRTVGGQEKPHEGLVEVGKHQRSRTFEDTEGTLVGFRCPQYMQGVGVAGLHLHYISKDLQHGGHVLELEGTGCICVAQISKFQLELPDADAEFDQAKLDMDDEGIKAVEGSAGGKWDKHDSRPVKGEHFYNKAVTAIEDKLPERVAQSLREDIGDGPPASNDAPPASNDAPRANQTANPDEAAQSQREETGEDPPATNSAPESAGSWETTD